MNYLLKYLILIFVLFGTNNIFGQQDKCYQTKKRKAKEHFNSAQKIKNISRNEAEKYLQEAIDIDSRYVDAYFLLGIVYFEKAEKNQKKNRNDEAYYFYEKGIKSFKRVEKLCEKFKDYTANFYLGKTYYNQKQYAQSKKFFSEFVKQTNDSTKKEKAKLCLENIEIYVQLINNPVDYNPVALANVNSKHDEYLPLISPDGDYLWFTKRVFSDNADFKETFMISEKTSEKTDIKEKFSKGTVMPYPFNDGRNQGAATITADNNKMFITICGLERDAYTSYKNCDIYYTIRKHGNWQRLERFGSEINNVLSFESQPSITADGKTLFFASARRGGFGGIDIYRSDINEFGSWSEAENLGEKINTEGDDKTPFIHPDGRTLYFASNSRFGLGGFDIFYTKYNEETGWTKPKNIGYPLNTQNNELAFCVSADGKRLYFSSQNISKKKNWDIFSTSVPENALPQQVLLVKGKITGEDGDTITRVKIILKSIKDNEESEGSVEDSTGNYAISVAVDKDEKFILSAQKEGYFYHSEFIDPDKEKYIPPSLLDIKVKKIEINTPIILSNILFDFNKYELSDTAKICLTTLLDFLNDNKTVEIEIRGHTDNIGSETSNQKLSHDRAEAVYNHLIKEGISDKRLSFKAYGESNPTETNNTEEGRFINRRVEFIVTKK